MAGAVWQSPQSATTCAAEASLGRAIAGSGKLASIAGRWLPAGPWHRSQPMPRSRASGRPSGFSDGPEIRRVAVQALADRFGRDRTAQITGRVGRDGGVLHRPAPLRRARIVRDAQLADLSLFFACQERLPLVVRPQCELDHGAERCALSTSVTALTRSPVGAKRCVDARVVGVGDVSIRPGQALQDRRCAARCGRAGSVAANDIRPGWQRCATGGARRTGPALASSGRRRRMPRAAASAEVASATLPSWRNVAAQEPCCLGIELPPGGILELGTSLGRAAGLEQAAGEEPSGRAGVQVRRRRVSGRAQGPPTRAAAAPAGSNSSDCKPAEPDAPRSPPSPAVCISRSAASTASVIERVSAQYRDRASRVSAWSGCASRAAPSDGQGRPDLTAAEQAAAEQEEVFRLHGPGPEPPIDRLGRLVCALPRRRAREQPQCAEVGGLRLQGQTRLHPPPRASRCRRYAEIAFPSRSPVSVSLRHDADRPATSEESARRQMRRDAQEPSGPSSSRFPPRSPGI